MGRAAAYSARLRACGDLWRSAVRPPDRPSPLENIARSIVSPEDGLVVVMNRPGEVLAR
ncbi:MAG: hypothetical protein MJ061_05370 [Mailhella sp.]|nr:hypothetical protein [Mailhella sp.]